MKVQARNRPLKRLKTVEKKMFRVVKLKSRRKWYSARIGVVVFAMALLCFFAVARLLSAAGLIGSYQQTTSPGEFAQFTASPRIDNYTRFPAGISGTIDVGSVQLRKQGSPTFDIEIVIKDDSGTELTRSQSISAASLATTFDEIALSFSPNPTVAQGEFLRLSFEVTGGDGGNYVASMVNDTSIPTNYSVVDPLNNDTEGNFITIFTLESESVESGFCGSGTEFVGGLTVGTASGQDRAYAQTFQTPSSGFWVDTIKIPLVENISDHDPNYNATVTVSIRATSGGLPTGSDLWSDTITGDELLQYDESGEGIPHQSGNDFKCENDTAEYEISFDVNGFALSASTVYAVVIRCSADCGSADGDELRYYVYSSSGISSGEWVTSINGGSTWSGGDGSDRPIWIFGSESAPPTPTPTPTNTPTPTPTKTPIPVLVSPTAGASGLIDFGADTTNLGTFLFRLLVLCAGYVISSVLLARIPTSTASHHLLMYALISFIALAGNLFQNFLAGVILVGIIIITLFFAFSMGKGDAQ